MDGEILDEGTSAFRREQRSPGGRERQHDIERRLRYGAVLHVRVLGDTEAIEAARAFFAAEPRVASAALLPDGRWTAGVRRGCADLGDVPDDQVDDFFELFRIQVEDEGGTRQQSLAAVQALVGGFAAACPELGNRLQPLIPVS